MKINIYNMLISNLRVMKETIDLINNLKYKSSTKSELLHHTKHLDQSIFLISNSSSKNRKQLH